MSWLSSRGGSRKAAGSPGGAQVAVEQPPDEDTAASAITDIEPHTPTQTGSQLAQHESRNGISEADDGGNDRTPPRLDASTSSAEATLPVENVRNVGAAPSITARDLHPLLLGRDGDRWARLTDECSSALALMGGPTEVGVTSCVRGEGRSTIAVAMALAQGYRFGTTVLVEADLEKPSLAGILELREGPGLAEVLREEALLGDCIQWTTKGLGVVTAGAVGPEPSWLSAPSLTERLLPELRGLCEAVVADLPPFLGPGVGVVRSFPKVVLVIRAGATPLDRVERVAAELNGAPAILNRAGEDLPRWVRRVFRPRR